MPYEQKDMSGSIFLNRKREKDSHPNLTGSGMVNGKEVWISGWRKIDKNGDEWISLAFKEKEPRREEAPQQRREEQRPVDRAIPKLDFNDEVPF